MQVITEQLSQHSYLLVSLYTLSPHDLPAPLSLSLLCSSPPFPTIQWVEPVVRQRRRVKSVCFLTAFVNAHITTAFLLVLFFLPAFVCSEEFSKTLPEFPHLFHSSLL